MIKKQSKAKQASTIAVTAALYVTFFLLSFSITVPNFTLLYLPIILLGVFPLWFGWSGLVGSMIGAFIGGVYVEALPLLFMPEFALPLLAGTFALNLPFAVIACPALIRAVSPKLKIWGMYSGNFAEWRSSRARAN